MRDNPPCNADRFLALLKPLERDLEVYCRRLIWEPQDAVDAIQNTMLRAFAAFDRYREDASFRAWMFRIMTNEVFALNRRHARIARHEFQIEPEELDELGPSGPACPSDVGDMESEALMEALDQNLVIALKTLTDLERAVLLLRAIGGFRYHEIATSMDIPLGSVMGYLARARQKMRRAIARSTPDTYLPRKELP